MKHLIAIDSDGTLRHSDGSITKETKSTISKLINSGNVILLCTGRPRYHGLTISSEVGIDSYLISSNGAEVYDIKNEKVVFGYYLPKYVVKRIYRDSKKYDLRVVFACDNIEYVTKFTRTSSQILLDDNNINELIDLDVKQAMFIGSDVDNINNYKNIVKNEYHYKVVDEALTFNSEVYFSIVNKQSSKGNAIKKLAVILDMKDIIAIGNDVNDLTMFEVATTSVCVNNAEDSIKEHAKVIVESNDEDGVRKYLETLL